MYVYPTLENTMGQKGDTIANVSFPHVVMIDGNFCFMRVLHLNTPP